MAIINLPHMFEPRPWQQELWDRVIPMDFQRGIIIVPRRNGKDLTCWNLCIAKAMQRVGLYYYISPYYNQIRQIIWEGMDGSGRRFRDYIPAELVSSMTKIDMRINLVNGSQIKLLGSDNIDNVVGTNPVGIVYTEFALHKIDAWTYLRPVLAENGGWALFNSTPRSYNHCYDLFEHASRDEEWFAIHLTRDDTGVPTLEAIEKDRKSGMPEELINQEYYCSWVSGNVGSYYSSYIEAVRADGRICSVPWDPMLPVYTSWDLGVGDSMAIWFAQVYGKEVRLIDYYENHSEGLPHYIKELREKPYTYEEHFAPHDIEVRELTTGVTRRETAQSLGINFTVIPRANLDDGIEAVRTFLSRCWFDKVKCAQGLNALLNYEKSYNEKTEAYSNKPLHNWASNGADSFRYLAQGSGYMDSLGASGVTPPPVVGMIGQGRPRSIITHTYTANDSPFGSNNIAPPKVVGGRY